ncbi:FAD-dependent oxidoreductase [Bradyrhizobium sp. BRP22]|uniref:hydroxysqualene dehydroxylase n=1 Tax=Bradyrhizobium sp. BRP22 TaxID=2793821 RepID=UPI001CD3708F|nr:FAD-dependent oxidoreductase [Bradyrhizobium sp. BRP22]MCA1452695.1 FAD-dependent oxidoreductase [Bradyrhizobium sp. BRP22]
MPEVIVVGSGLAGMSAATRLIERGFDITLYEQNNFLGGKLGAHRDSGSPDPHEHCYHMYLNWYNNFWQFMREIGAADKFIPSPVIGCRSPGDKQTRPYLTNPGSPATILTNMLNGVASPADQFLSAYSLLDLIGTQWMSGAVLEQTSVSGFFRSRGYSTEGSIAASARTLAEAFASPSYLSSARSYQSLVKYGYRHPTPSLWLLTQNTNDAIFEPWRRHLEARAKALGRRFEIHHRARVESLHLRDGQVRELTLGEMPEEPTTDRNDEPTASKVWKVDVPGDLVLAVPPGPLDRLVSPEVAACAPELERVRLLRSEPMISVDAYFKRRIPGLTGSITLLLGSNYTLSLLDISQVWTDRPAEAGTALNVISSNADLIADYPKDVILDVILKELQRFLDFQLDDVDYTRCHVQTNVGEELFVNQVGSWVNRPKAICKIPNLFLAGDFCQTFVDVVTVEGAVVSGLLAAEALRRRRGIGAPIDIIQPDSYPALLPATLAAALRPAAFAAKAVSMADTMMRTNFSRILPNG